MPYLIAVVVIIVAGVAFTLFQSTPATEPETTTTSETGPPENEPAEMENNEPATSNAGTAASAATFTDGTYTGASSYFTPRRVQHEVGVTLTIADDVITDVNVTYDDGGPKNPNQGGFDEAYEEAVVGQSLSEVNLSRVGGASLTSDAFNEAVTTIEAEARG